MGMIEKPNNNYRLCKCINDFYDFKNGEYYWAELGERWLRDVVIVYFREKKGRFPMSLRDFPILFKWVDLEWE